MGYLFFTVFVQCRFENAFSFKFCVIKLPTQYLEIVCILENVVQTLDCMVGFFRTMHVTNEIPASTPARREIWDPTL